MIAALSWVGRLDGATDNPGWSGKGRVGVRRAEARPGEEFLDTVVMALRFVGGILALALVL